MVGVDRELLAAGLLFAEAEERVDFRGGVGAIDPGTAGAPLELGGGRGCIQGFASTQ